MLNTSSSPLIQAFQSLKNAFIGVGLFSGLINILMLTGSFFMLQVYDRVLTSRSIPTLIGLSILALALYAFQGVLEVIRSRILIRIASSVDASLASRVFKVVVTLPLKGRNQSDGMEPMRDLDTIRGFLSGPGPSAIADLPWLPLYVGICFILHPIIGWMTVLGAIILGVLAWITETRSRAPQKEAIKKLAYRNILADSSRRNAEVVRALGMTKRLTDRWTTMNEVACEANERASDVSGGIGGISKVARMVIQSAVLAVGAYLVIHGDATGGVIIASSILTGRAFAPVELAIANWKGFIAARQSAIRLDGLLKSFPEGEVPLELPKPEKTIDVSNLSISAPAGERLIVNNVSFGLKAGEGLGIIGPNGSGKSTLVRALVGVWPAVKGEIRLDGATLDQWDPDQIGRSIGYLPQAIELFDGTVAENIARFDPDAKAADVLAAAQAAGAHELILSMPNGYATRLGDGGGMLSTGQRQRIALARALYGDPFMVVLDEPNANLDAEGEAALNEALMGVRKRGGIVVIVAHRQAALAATDKLMVLANGQLQSFGPRDDVLAYLHHQAQQRRSGRPAISGQQGEGARQGRIVQMNRGQQGQGRPPQQPPEGGSQPSQDTPPPAAAAAGE